MSGATREWRISLRRQAGLLALTLFGAVASGLITITQWDIWWISGIVATSALGFAAVSVVLAVTLVTRPVMLRVSPTGMYIHRLGASLPWEAFAAIRPFRWRKQILLELVERPGGHPAFDIPAIRNGENANALVGLPPLLIDFERSEGSALDVLRAIEALGPPASDLVLNNASPA